jgi:stage IV sporulation protein FB
MTDDFYPPKPELVEPKQKSSLSVTIFSLVLFVLAFMLFFGDEINFIFYLIVVLLVHELGHLAFMKLFGYKNVRMLFVPLMGAFVQGKKQQYSQRQSFFVTLAGPIPGIVIGTILYIYGNQFHSVWMVEIGLLFLLLNLINLLPLDPLDGGQLFKLMVGGRTEMFLMIFALISSVAVIGLGWFMDSVIIMVFGFFMAFRVRALQKQYLMHKDLAVEHIDYRKYIDQVGDDEADPIIASQVNNVLTTPVKRDAGIMFKLLTLVVWLGAFAVPFLLYKLVNLQWFLSTINFD